jgi:hypothetical protein
MSWKQRLSEAIDQSRWKGKWKLLSTNSDLGETFVRDVLDPQYDKDPSVSNFLKLCASLGVRPGAILDGDAPTQADADAQSRESELTEAKELLGRLQDLVGSLERR